MTRVLITSTRVPEEGEALRELEAAGCELIVDLRRSGHAEEEMMALVPGVDAVIAGMEPFTERVFEVADRLRLIARTGVGYNAIDVDVATHLGVAVTIGIGTNDRAVADCAIGLMIAAARRIPQAHAQAKAGVWDRPTGYDVWQQTLGILGTGRIGRQVAQRATGFEMRILAYDTVQDPAWADSLGVRYVPLDELVRESDFITVHVPLFAETRGIIGERELRMMKRNAIVVNTARGGLIDEPALQKALREGWIAGAALDVVEVEPPEGAHPFAELDNAVITPHLAGGTRGSVKEMSRAAIDEVLRLTRGERPLHVVNPAALERWGR